MSLWMDQLTEHGGFLMAALCLAMAGFARLRSKGARLIHVFATMVVCAFGLMAQNTVQGPLRMGWILVAVGALAQLAFGIGTPSWAPIFRLSPPVLVMTAGHALVFTAKSDTTVVLGWLLATVPLLRPRRLLPEDQGPAVPASFKVSQWGAILCLILGLGALRYAGQSVEPHALFLRALAPGLLVLAAMLRQGFFPFQGFHASFWERGAWPLLVSWSTAPVGVFLMIQYGGSWLTTSEGHGLSILSWFLIASLPLCGLLALVQRTIRAWVFLSQVFLTTIALIFWGSIGGDAGFLVGQLALLQASLTGAGIMTLVGLIQMRLGPEDDLTSNGLATVMPRISSVILVLGLSVVGLPMTLGYTTEDLMLHLSHHMAWPAVLSLVVGYISMAIGFYRIYSDRFFGTPTNVTVDDLLGRETMALMLLLAPLFVVALVPHLLR